MELLRWMFLAQMLAACSQLLCMGTVDGSYLTEKTRLKIRRPQARLAAAKRSNTGQCDAIFERVGDKCLYTSPVPGNWHQAREFCMALGAHLATIDGLGDQNLITDYIISNQLLGSGFWLGAYDMGHEGIWVWDHNGMQIGYSNWQPHEPNNAPDQMAVSVAGVKDADCLALVRNQLKTEDLPAKYQWLDESCEDAALYFLCEKEA